MQVLYAVGEDGVVRGWNCETFDQVVGVDVEVAEEDGDVQLNDIVVLPATNDDLPATTSGE